MRWQGIIFLILVISIFSFHGVASEDDTLNPKYVNLLYSDVWLQGGVANVIVKAYNQADELYNPQNISFSIDEQGIVLTDSSTKDNSVDAIFKISENTKIGNYTLFITIQDEKTIEKQINFQVQENPQIKVRQEQERQSDSINTIILLVVGIFALIIIIIIIIAIIIDSGRKRS